MVHNSSAVVSPKVRDRRLRSGTIKLRITTAVDYSICQRLDQVIGDNYFSEHGKALSFDRLTPLSDADIPALIIRHSAFRVCKISCETVEANRLL